MKSRVLCIGNIVADMVLVDAEMPDEGSMTTFLRKELSLGGCASNCAVALARLGIPVTIAGKVGRDPEGIFCTRALIENAVKTHIVYAEEDTAFSLVMIPPRGNRRIMHTMGASRSFHPWEVLPEYLLDSKVLSIGGLGILPLFRGENLVGLLRIARRLGLIIVADTATNPTLSQSDWEEILGPCYEYFDVFFPSREESFFISGQNDPEKACLMFRERGVTTAGVKLGDKGSIVSSPQGTFWVPPYDVHCVDTLGAGDAFMAGYIVATLSGYTQGQSARTGNFVGAYCVSAVGASAGIPPFEEIRRAMLNDALQST